MPKLLGNFVSGSREWLELREGDAVRRQTHAELQRLLEGARAQVEGRGLLLQCGGADFGDCVHGGTFQVVRLWRDVVGG